MLGYTELALNDVQGMPSTKKKLDMVLRAGGRATALIKQILSFSISQKSLTKEVKLRAFDPFFTTKDLGEGTGMGLSTVHGIIAELGGFVSLHSEPGKGTAIQVFIPLITEPAEVGRGTAPEPIKAGTERILFVDDEHIQTELAKDALSQYGYQVTTFSDSVIALVHFQQNPNQKGLGSR